MDKDLALIAALAAAASAVFSAIIGSLTTLIIGLRNFKANSRLADASIINAKTASAAAESADALRKEELQRNGVAAVCKFDTELLERLRSALGELASIAHGEADPIRVTEEQRQRGLFLSLQLKMMIYPNTPLNEQLHLDIAKIRGHLSSPDAMTICNRSLWMRYFDNSLWFLDIEENRIRDSFATGTYIARASLVPATTMEDSYRVHGYH